MPNRADVREAVALTLNHALEACDVYAETWPVGCSRPFVLVTSPAAERTDLDRFTIEETVSVEATYFAEAGADTRTVDLAAQQILDSFRKGFLPVDDRAVKIAVEGAELAPNRARVRLSCVYTVPRDPEPDTPPLMGEIDTNMQV